MHGISRMSENSVENVIGLNELKFTVNKAIYRLLIRNKIISFCFHIAETIACLSFARCTFRGSKKVNCIPVNSAITQITIFHIQFNYSLLSLTFTWLLVFDVVGFTFDLNIFCSFFRRSSPNEQICTQFDNFNWLEKLDRGTFIALNVSFNYTAYSLYSNSLF